MTKQDKPSESKALIVPTFEGYVEELGKGKAYFKPQGIKLTGSYNKDDLHALIGKLVGVKNFTSIGLGDAIVAGEDKFGESAAQVEAVFGLEYGTIANYASIARRVPFHVRPNAVLSTRVLAAVAPLHDYPNGDDLQADMLAQAVEDKATSETVRKAVLQYQIGYELKTAKPAITPEAAEQIRDNAEKQNWNLGEVKQAIYGAQHANPENQADDTGEIAIISPQEAQQAGYGADNGQSEVDGEIRTLQANLRLLANHWRFLADEAWARGDDMTANAYEHCITGIAPMIDGEIDAPPQITTLQDKDSLQDNDSTTFAAEQDLTVTKLHAEAETYQEFAEQELLLVDPSTGEILQDEPAPKRKSKTPYPKKYRDAIYDELASICKLDPKVHSGRLGKATTQVLEMGKNVTHVQAFPAWWKANHWKGRKGQHPNPQEVVDNLIAATEAQEPDGSRFINGKYADEIQH